MESYRRVWDNLFNYLKEHWKIKDFEKIDESHIVAYINYKIEYYPSRQYLQKIVSALGKLEIALNYFSKQKYNIPKEYDFSIRKTILSSYMSLNLVAENYHNRSYKNPAELINNLLDDKHRLAASIEYEGGSRIEGCSLIKKEQILGIKIDKITNEKKGVIFTKEKGGKEGEVLLSLTTYKKLKWYIEKHGIFRLNRQMYMKDIRETCARLNVAPEGTHGLRWNFAKRRIFEYAKAGYSYKESLKLVSSEMKHNRASITLHYLC